MASSKEYLNYVLEQLSNLKDIDYKAMMGEYIIYYKGKIIGGIYDDRFLIKPTKTAKEILKNAPFEDQYKGAKEMILVENMEDKEFLSYLFENIVDKLPAVKKKNKSWFACLHLLMVLCSSSNLLSLKKSWIATASTKPRNDAEISHKNNVSI